MKKILILILILSSSVVFAQQFKYGIKAGIGSSYYSFDETTYINASTKTVVRISPIDQNVGWNIGILGSYAFSETPISLRLAAQYTGLGGQVNILDGFANSSNTIKEFSGRVDIPLSVTLNLNKFRILAGVGYAIDVNRSQNVANFINDQYASTGAVPFVVTSNTENYMTYHFGIGLEYDKFSIDLVFDNPASQNFDGTEGVSYNFGPNAQLVTFNFGFYL